MKEQVLTFGKNGELTGVLSEPDTTNKTAPYSILFLNAGFLHRVGFNRFNTDSSRTLAEKGMFCLRFDLHGLGDSAHYSGRQSYDDVALSDINEAVTELLKKSNTPQCVLVGLCSGADYAHSAAVRDRRIKGIVFIDGYAYPTLGFYLRDYGPAFFSLTKIYKYANRLLSGGLKRKGPEKQVSQNLKEAEVYEREFPPKTKIVGEIRELVKRGTHLYYIYSGGVPIYYNHKGQFRAMFRFVNFKSQVRSEYIREADHTYTVIETREKLLKLIIEWIQNVQNS